LVAPSTYSSGTVYTAWQQFVYNWAVITVSDTWFWVSNTKADSNCDTNDIAIWSGVNIQVWAACNMWATTAVPFASTASVVSWNTTPDATEVSRIGYQYQWWRNDDTTAWANIVGQYNWTLTSNSTSNNSFYKWDATSWEWYAPETWSTTPTRWNASNGGNNQGPCPNGYHVPTGWTSTNTTQWWKALTIANSQTSFWTCSQSIVYDRIRCMLMLPLTGQRDWFTWVYTYQWSYGYYWSSSPYNANAYLARFTSGAAIISYDFARGYGLSVRCVRN
jgi:hypothetical protein